MSEFTMPMPVEELRAAISKTANELYLTVFSQYGKYINSKASFEENLYTLLSEQNQVAFQNRIKRRVKAAGFPQLKTMDMFQMSKDILPNLDFDEVNELATCKFIDEKLDVCAFSPSGHGKTHLALAIGYEAIKRGYTVKFRRASDLINEMTEAKSERKLTDYIRVMTRCSMLIVDEVGYFDYDASASSLLFQVIGARYEIGSTFYTSNQTFSEWAKFIGSDTLAKAIVSRIAHHAVLLDMNGPNAWRFEHARSRHLKP
ncbi:MAG: IS21-like element helper ATPase IstB [Oscillospiraceae bacterium]|nr:IS21-like element helper ATPase IstB [Oscillospiraceae bacterium]